MDACYFDLLAEVADVLFEANPAKEHARTRHPFFPLVWVPMIIVHFVLLLLQERAEATLRCHEHCGIPFFAAHHIVFVVWAFLYLLSLRLLYLCLARLRLA